MTITRAAKKSVRFSGLARASADPGKHWPGLIGVVAVVVSDDSTAMALCEPLLVLAGVTVLTAVTPDAAMDLLAVIRPTVLVVDVSTLDDGVTPLITRVRALISRHGGEVPALAWSASKATGEALIDAGFQEWLPKPADPVDFLSAIARLTKPHHALS